MFNDLTKSNYKPCLDDFISQCELNYALILKLLPWLNVNKKPSLDKTNTIQDIEALMNQLVKFRPVSGHKVDLVLNEQAKYTSTMTVRIHSPTGDIEADIILLIRLYHDARLLEVMDKEGPKALQPVNRGDDLLDKQADEKRQLNRFLGESLKMCLRDRKINIKEDDDDFADSNAEK